MRPVNAHGPRHRTRGLIVPSLALLVLLAGPVQAADSASAEALKALKAARSKKDAALVTELAGKLVELHNAAEGKAAKAPIQAALGGLLKAKKLEGVQAAAAQALGRLDDVEGAYKQLKVAFPSPKAKSTDGLSMDVLAATGVLKPPAAIDPTLKLIAKGKDAALLKLAAQNVGAYAESKERIKITRALCDALVRYRKEFDKGAKSKKPTEQQSLQARWNEVAPAIRTSLNLLVGAERTSADEWLTAYEEAKGKPEAWFQKG